ncbi:Protein of unknown function DUF2065 [Hyphomicrobium denitrificans ATCC 51888]|uniref:DUF2065 domain-containing protein n=1 Tax=Hyphomicrobium denitrificans (strain ATCC 51888 / DSM 1869 / NCIMB 11706 / TK 0415) TaxID=582899 RepID=D8JQU6_HYPDA|nr:DUF2065 domain-containing protein [Hyphomicrobium denitrificans]ADJ22098.1 Protein of unknown function DUF2065 [Hyphomicrobium denitrificans ATCC 51888]
MNDLLTGLGVALVLEGLLWAVAPDAARRVVTDIASRGNGPIQAGALVAVAFGVFLVWLVRG